ncbi:uncharacterized protein LOC143186650 [Calliopsis andreniformis]|uniref:uncharacterized protein LOC143186650 n=1 Tax=Calliopsis andreniformis TaxID=337506 RepID=UPI003FCDE46F
MAYSAHTLAPLSMGGTTTATTATTPDMHAPRLQKNERRGRESEGEERARRAVETATGVRNAKHTRYIYPIDTGVCVTSEPKGPPIPSLQSCLVSSCCKRSFQGPVAAVSVWKCITLHRITYGISCVKESMLIAVAKWGITINTLFYVHVCLVRPLPRRIASPRLIMLLASFFELPWDLTSPANFSAQGQRAAAAASICDAQLTKGFSPDLPISRLLQPPRPPTTLIYNELLFFNPSATVTLPASARSSAQQIYRSIFCSNPLLSAPHRDPRTSTRKGFLLRGDALGGGRRR